MYIWKRIVKIFKRNDHEVRSFPVSPRWVLGFRELLTTYFQNTVSRKTKTKTYALSAHLGKVVAQNFYVDRIENSWDVVGVELSWVDEAADQNVIPLRCTFHLLKCMIRFKSLMNDAILPLPSVAPSDRQSKKWYDRYSTIVKSH